MTGRVQICIRIPTDDEISAEFPQNGRDKVFIAVNLYDVSAPGADVPGPPA